MLQLFCDTARRWTLVARVGLLAPLLAAGCSTTSPPSATVDAAAATPIVFAPQATQIPVVRQGRYTLVELVPETAQRDLLLQVIDITLPPSSQTTVGDGLQYLLRYSGYRLCADDAEGSVLYAQPLPAAHMHLGPLTLRDALLTIAGSAWNLSVDDASRQVCFHRAAEASAEGTAGTCTLPPLAGLAPEHRMERP